MSSGIYLLLLRCFIYVLTVHKNWAETTVAMQCLKMLITYEGHAFMFECITKDNLIKLLKFQIDY